MENYRRSYIDEYNIAALHRRRRRKKRKASIGLVFTLGIILAALIGIALRFSAWGQAAKITTGSSLENEVSEQIFSQNDVSSPAPISLPETVEILSRSIPLGDTLLPDNFVNGLEGSGFSVQFENEPKFDVLGQQQVTLFFASDAGIIKEVTNLYIFELIDEVIVTMGNGEVADVRCFIPDHNIGASFVGLSPAQIPEQKCGIFDLVILCDETEYPVKYVIEETIPPHWNRSAGIYHRRNTAAG